MDTDETQSPRVSFGPRPDDSMPLSWAEKMLTALKEKKPKQFGDLLRDAVIMGSENGHGGSSR